MPRAAEQRSASGYARLAGAAFGLAVASLANSATARTAAPTEPIEPIVELVDQGRHAEAEARIAARLADPVLDADTRRALLDERERMRRISLDFPHDRDALAAQLRRTVPGVTDAEIAAWHDAGLLEHCTIDGETRWFDRAASNLFRLDAGALSRRDPKLGPLSEGPFERFHPHHRAVREAARTSGRTSVEPRRVRVTQSLTVGADAVPAGEAIRAWIPYPRAIAGQQEDLVLVASEPARHRLAPESALQRTVHFTRAAKAGEPTTFSVTYELTVYARDSAIDRSKVAATKPGPELAPHLVEQPPHVRFTPAIRAWSREVVGDATHPYEVAKRIYDAVDRVPWAGAREYSTLRNIPEYVLETGHGDCGQQTLLLITALRLNGIPARWQSGWVYSDAKYSNLHDWGQLWLAPYGWVPVDVTTGKLPDAPPGLEYFYLGGIDAYRIAMNDDWGREFAPPKSHLRSDTVDSQRGEAEWDGGNLYYDQWDYAFDWQLLPVREARTERTGQQRPTSGEGK